MSGTEAVPRGRCGFPGFQAGWLAATPKGLAFGAAKGTVEDMGQACSLWHTGLVCDKGWIRVFSGTVQAWVQVRTRSSE